MPVSSYKAATPHLNAASGPIRFYCNDLLNVLQAPGEQGKEAPAAVGLVHGT